MTFTCPAVWPGDILTMFTDVICKRYQGRTRHDRTYVHLDPRDGVKRRGPSYSEFLLRWWQRIGRTSQRSRTVWHGKAHFFTCQVFLSQRREITISPFSKIFRPFLEISEDVPMTSEHCRRAPKMFWWLSNIAGVLPVCVKSTQMRIMMLIYWIIF